MNNKQINVRVNDGKLYQLEYIQKYYLSAEGLKLSRNDIIVMSIELMFKSIKKDSKDDLNQLSIFD